MACSESPISVPIDGTYDNGGGQQLQFNPDGSALWIFEMPNSDTIPRDTFHIQYHYDTVPNPDALDLSGFDHGFLKGKTLFGIAAFLGDSLLRFDSEPAPSDTNAADVRPFDFDPIQTQSYRKID